MKNPTTITGSDLQPKRPLAFRWNGKDYTKPFGGYYSIGLNGISFNEGSAPLNFTIEWSNGLFVYVFFKGRRWSRKFFGRKIK